MSKNKTRLLLLRNEDLKIVREETEKINKSSTHIARNKITELKELSARGVTVIVVGNGHDDTSSNPGRV